MACTIDADYRLGKKSVTSVIAVARNSMMQRNDGILLIRGDVKVPVYYCTSHAMNLCECVFLFVALLQKVYISAIETAYTNGRDQSYFHITSNCGSGERKVDFLFEAAVRIILP